MCVAMGTGRDAARTEVVAAGGAHGGAVATQGLAASLAVAAAVFIHRFTTI